MKVARGNRGMNGVRRGDEGERDEQSLASGYAAIHFGSPPMTARPQPPGRDLLDDGGRLSAQYRVAAWLVIAQGAVMEVGAFLAMPVLVMLDVDESGIGEHFHFALRYFRDILYLLMVMSGIFGVLRVLGGVGILRNRLWGLVVTAVMCLVTLVLMIFMLPAGIADGLLSGGALVLIVVSWCGQRPLPGRKVAEGCGGGAPATGQ